ncbi:hypothetical protein [Xenorhabdus szentirmaii]|uniref:hypothetical protein n=1 Tax=Xenorhabdus szentirmaii TaxID=290112 RepID=UPI000C0A8346|nr:hypothetical protein [Xenorhabdus szentirmaii]PHM30389.1 hypothetical protein Xsze_04229 [Xenorhabdus szentirmaii DSM 16338]
MCTDPDLYNCTVTFRFHHAHQAAVNALREDLPISVTEMDEDEDDTLTASADAVVREEGNLWPWSFQNYTKWR